MISECQKVFYSRRCTALPFRAAQSTRSWSQHPLKYTSSPLPRPPPSGADKRAKNQSLEAFTLSQRHTKPERVLSAWISFAFRSQHQLIVWPPVNINIESSHSVRWPDHGLRWAQIQFNLASLIIANGRQSRTCIPYENTNLKAWRTNLTCFSFVERQSQAAHIRDSDYTHPYRSTYWGREAKKFQAMLYHIFFVQKIILTYY